MPRLFLFFSGRLRNTRFEAREYPNVNHVFLPTPHSSWKMLRKRAIYQWW